MDKIIELGYILTMLISAACFTLHAVIRAKNLTSTSRILKWKSTTAFLFLILIYNVCDFLIIYLNGSLKAASIAWIYVTEKFANMGFVEVYRGILRYETGI